MSLTPSPSLVPIPIPERSSRRRPSAWVQLSPRSSPAPLPSPATTPRTYDDHVLFLVREALTRALGEDRHRVHESLTAFEIQSATSITVDLNTKEIAALSPDAVDLMSREVER
jgi:hypothetical protein